jgi:hypothetical protein
MLAFVGMMLDLGFVAVTSPYAEPPSAPWPEQGKAAVLRRLREDRLRGEWLALDHEVTFLDLCWFTWPNAAQGRIDMPSNTERSGASCLFTAPARAAARRA